MKEKPNFMGSYETNMDFNKVRFLPLLYKITLTQNNNFFHPGPAPNDLQTPISIGKIILHWSTGFTLQRSFIKTRRVKEIAPLQTSLPKWEWHNRGTQRYVLLPFRNGVRNVAISITLRCQLNESTRLSFYLHFFHPTRS